MKYYKIRFCWFNEQKIRFCWFLMVATETGSQSQSLNGRAWAQATSSQRIHNAIDPAHSRLRLQIAPPTLSRLFLFSLLLNGPRRLF